jgi:hypothetical protein
LPTALYDAASGYNDTYHLIITSGSSVGAPKFTWEQESLGTTYAGTGQGPHDLGEGLTFEFSGVIEQADQFDIDVYIPQPLASSFVWSFTTHPLSGNTPPTTPVEPSLIIDLTEDGGSSAMDSDDETPLLLVNAWPDNLAYGVRPDLPLIMLEFNKTLLSGSLDPNSLSIRCSALMGAPNVSSTGAITPMSIEYSGVYLKIWL